MRWILKFFLAWRLGRNSIHQKQDLFQKGQSRGFLIVDMAKSGESVWMHASHLGTHVDSCLRKPKDIKTRG